MKTPTHTLRPHNFTMIEVLTAIALTMVVGWLVNMAFNNTSLASRRVTATLELQAQGETIMSIIGADFRNLSQWVPMHVNKSTDTIPTIQEHELKFGLLMPTYRSAIFPMLAGQKTCNPAAFYFWDENASTPPVLISGVSSFRNEHRGIEWRFMAGVSNEYGNGISNLFTAAKTPKAEGYKNGIPRLLSKRNFSNPPDHSYGTSLSETTDKSSRNVFFQTGLDAAKLGYYVAAGSIRDFRMDGYENDPKNIRVEKSPCYYLNQPEIYYSQIFEGRVISDGFKIGIHINPNLNPRNVARKTNGVICHYITVSFFITNAPMSVPSEKNDTEEAVLSPRCVAAITVKEERERRQAITDRYVWAYFQRVFATQ